MRKAGTQMQENRNHDILEWIADIEKECFTDPWSLKSLEDTVRQNCNVIYVAYREKIETGSREHDRNDSGISCCVWSDYQGSTEALAGYLIADRIADESELLRIAVPADRRELGCGETLIRYYHAENDKMCIRYLLEVRESNIPARKLYEKCGYNSMGVRKNYYDAPVENALLYEYIPDGNA